VIAGSLRKLFK